MASSRRQRRRKRETRRRQKRARRDLQGEPVVSRDGFHRERAVLRAASGAFARPRRRRRATRWVLRLVGLGCVALALLLEFGVLGFLALDRVFPLDASSLDRVPYSRVVVDDEGTVLRVERAADDAMRIHLPLAKMTRWLPLATVAVEDRRFFSHLGVDPNAVLRAASQNLVRGRIHSGASTLTMQLARLVDPRPRSLRGKTIEAFRAWQIERALSKDEILERYLNLAPYGGDLVGVEAAARRYFGKSAQRLDLAEAALLAGLPQSPTRYRPDRHLDRAWKRARVVLGAMLETGTITRTQHEIALGSRPEVSPHAWPLRAPHLCDLVLDRASREDRTIVSTLRMSVQEPVERVAAEFAKRSGDGPLSLAVVVLDVETGDVLGLVGSRDYFDDRVDGQWNAALARRSPGSALKPFLYALAFDRGLATPSGFLADLPIPRAGYAPENFDRLHRGPIAARDALSLSLNAPAVRLLARLGVGGVITSLRELGLSTLDGGAERYGLSLALGGGEVRLLDLANAYRALVRLGACGPWRVRVPRGDSQDGADVVDRRVFSAAAARSVLDALSGDEHLARVSHPSSGPLDPILGYKTGTSFGQRDAWCIAFSMERVVGVWVGAARGPGDAELIGARVAAPMALRLAAVLSRGASQGWRDAPGLVARLACAESGYPARDACPRGRSELFLAHAPLASCEVHRRVFVDEVAHLERCSACLGERDLEERVVAEWPAEIQAWIEASSPRVPGSPRFPHASGCVRAVGTPPRILSPAHGAEYVLVPGSSRPQRLPLEAAAPGDASRVFWFVDGQLFASASRGERVFWPLSTGTHEIRCAADRGQTARARIRVRGP